MRLLSRTTRKSLLGPRAHFWDLYLVYHWQRIAVDICLMTEFWDSSKDLFTGCLALKSQTLLVRRRSHTHRSPIPDPRHLVAGFIGRYLEERGGGRACLLALSALPSASFPSRYSHSSSPSRCSQSSSPCTPGAHTVFSPMKLECVLD